MKRRHDEESAPAVGGDDVHPSRKRRLEYSETDKQLAKLYSDLSDEVKTTRLKAAAGLVRALKDSETSRLDRAITRLVKGLCSSRKASRSGFFVALIEVLSLTKNAKHDPDTETDLTPHALISRFESLTEPDVSGTNQERRDHLLGRCVAFKALIQSKLVFQHAPKSADWEALLDRIISQSVEHVALRKDFGAVLYESLPVLAQTSNVDDSYATLLVHKLASANLARTAEGLAIWLTVSQLFPSVTMPKNVWHHNDPLNSKERAAVAKILKDNSSTEVTDSAQTAKSNTGTPQTMPSFAWTPVLQLLYKRYLESGKSAEFAKLWTEAVDNGYFSSSASPERKAIGFRLTAQTVGSAPPQLFPHVFTPNLLRCMINQRGDSSHYLFQLAKSPLDALTSRMKNEPDAAYWTFKALATDHGAVNIDQLTKTKTIDEALAKMPTGSFSEVLSLVRDIIMQPKVSEHLSADATRRIAADMILNYLRKQGSAMTDSSNALEILQTFSQIGFFVPLSKASDASPMPPLSKESQEMLRSRTMSCLNLLLNTHADPSFALPFDLVNYISKIASSGKYKLWLDLESAIQKTVRKAVEAAVHLSEQESKTKSTKKQSSSRAFKLLYSLTILQVYNGDTDAITVLDDLDMCYQSFKKSEGDSSLVLVEILLSFISKPSSLFRKLAEQVFTAFTSQLTDDGLRSMLDILEKKESLSGQQELFEQQDDELDGEEEDGEDDDAIEGADDSDVEMIEGEPDEDDDDESNASKEDSDEDEDDDDDKSMDDEQRAFEAKLAQALGTSQATEDDDASSTDGSEMDDDQMLALEGHLTTIFKERSKQSSKKKDNKDAKETIINFKSRVLDLLLIYVKQEHANPLALQLVLPLITLIRTTSSKQVADKGFAVLKQLPDACNKNKKFPVDADASELLDVVRAVADEIRLNASKVHNSACSRINLFLAKMLVNKDASNYNDVADIYTALQKEWYADPKSSIQPSIFTEFTSWSIATRKR